MEKSSTERLTQCSEDILATLDRFGSKSQSPVEDEYDDDQFNSSSERSSFINEPVGRLSFISADGSEIDSDYSSASSVFHTGSEEQRNLEFGSMVWMASFAPPSLGAFVGSKGQVVVVSLAIKVFLECLPERKEEWVSRTTKLRNDYTQFKSKCLFDPNKGKKEESDLTVFNPLSQDETPFYPNIFSVHRFPEIEFFQQSKVKEMMLNILFCHAKKNEALSYKQVFQIPLVTSPHQSPTTKGFFLFQGMHELLAPIVYVLHEDARSFQHLEGSSLKVAKVLMDSNFLEHDAFALFVQLMDQTETWYLQLPVADRSERNKFLDPHAEPFADQELMPSTAIVKKLSRIQEHMLRKYDPELRWIRLLFGREFPMYDVLVLWDALFADGPMLNLVDYVYISMLEAIRDKLLRGSYSACMGYLMKFPGGFSDVYRYVKTALILRENKTTSARSSPCLPNPPKHPPTHASATYPRQKKPEPKKPPSAFTSITKRYQQFVEPMKQGAVKPAVKPQATIPATAVNRDAEELLPKHGRPARPASVPAPEMKGERVDSGSQFSTPGKGVRSIKDKLMTRPRNRSRADYDALAQDHERLQKQVSSLKTELDRMQGLYLYCGRKMDSYIGQFLSNL
ncbi:TBC1 domain family member 5 [Acropora cervicornis]|uniref:TBC1 domain family member 5 n=1 Tax=Acropora cervicornis TaxID=6130 RepID=A0AAD9QZD0_ACRCE|nr:TBC1 domain family member 5 [Acropora cervicornis]